jgi:hypothetical protein
LLLAEHIERQEENEHVHEEEHAEWDQSLTDLCDQVFELGGFLPNES